MEDEVFDLTSKIWEKTQTELHAVLCGNCALLNFGGKKREEIHIYVYHLLILGYWYLIFTLPSWIHSLYWPRVIILKHKSDKVRLSLELFHGDDGSDSALTPLCAASDTSVWRMSVLLPGIILHPQLFLIYFTSTHSSDFRAHIMSRIDPIIVERST